MMKPKTCLLPVWLPLAAASLVLLPTLPGGAQNAPAQKDSPIPGVVAPAASPGAQAKSGESAATAADRAQAYYHLSLANIYEEEAVTSGRPEYTSFAVEEYKKALNADPGSAQLHNGLAELYFRTGRAHDAEVTARALLKSIPDDVDAHKLLGRIYLRQLSDGQNAVSSASP